MNGAARAVVPAAALLVVASCVSGAKGSSTIVYPAFDAPAGDDASAADVPPASDTGAADATPTDAAPTLLQPAASPCKSLHLALGAGGLFWSDEASGAIRLSPTAGGIPVTVVPGESSPRALVVRGSTMVWAAGTGGFPRVGAASLRSTTIAGGVPTTVVEPPGGVNGFTVSPDAATVYFATETTVSSVATAGGAATVVARDLRGGVPTALALDGSQIAYLGAVTGHVEVFTLRAGQAAACTSWTLTDNVACTAIVADNGALFFDAISLVGGVTIWADGATLKVVDLAQAPPDATTLALTTAGDVSALAVHGGSVFFADVDSTATDGGREGLIEVVSASPSPDAGTPTVLARNAGRATSIVVDGTNVIWATDDCRILSLPLPR